MIYQIQMIEDKRVMSIPKYYWIFLFATIISCSTPSKPWKVEVLAEGFEFTEGPVWLPQRGLIFSDIPANKVYLFDLLSNLKVFLKPSGNSNGLLLDHKGRLILAQHGSRQVGRLYADSIITLAASYNGQKLNSPNDLVQDKAGNIYFTDPPFGIMNNPDEHEELGFYGVYKLTPDNELILLDSSLTTPNGIGLSPDQKSLYVAESKTQTVFRWTLTKNALVEKDVLLKVDQSDYLDGMAVDGEGLLYVTGSYGVHIITSEGDLLQSIPIPGHTTNCAFNSDQSILYVTSGDKVYKAMRSIE